MDLPIQLPPIPKQIPFPGVIGVSLIVILTTFLIYVVGRFDHTGGVLAVSLMVIIAFFGALTFAVYFTIPNDESTSAAMGGLIAAFGAVVAYWLGRPHNPKE